MGKHRELKVIKGLIVCLASKHDILYTLSFVGCPSINNAGKVGVKMEDHTDNAALSAS